MVRIFGALLSAAVIRVVERALWNFLATAELVVSQGSPSPIMANFPRVLVVLIEV